MNTSRTQLLSEIRNWDLPKIEAAIEEALHRGSTSEEAFFVVIRADRFLGKGMTAEAEADAKRAIELATVAKDDDVLGMALGVQATIFNAQSKPEAEPQFRRAIELLEKSGNLISEAATRTRYGILLGIQGSPAEALVQFESALAIIEAIGQPSFQTTIKNGIACVYANTGDYHRAINAWKDTVLSAREHRQNHLLFPSLYNIAATYLDLDEIELAESYGKEAFTCASEDDNLEERALSILIFAGIHRAKGNFDQAIQEYEHAHTTFIQMDNGRSAAAVRKAIGVCLVDSGKIEEGIEVLQKATEELLVFTDPNELMKTYEALVTAYQQQGDYQSAFEYYQKQTVLKDEVFNSDFKNRLVTLEHKLEQQRIEAATKLFLAQARQLEIELRLQATANATQTELLSNFREDLRQIVKQSYDPVSALKKVSEQLKTLQVPKLDWAKIEKEFIALHPEFRRTLQQKFPSLTNQELRLCQLLRTGLKSNEAARLMYVSERGVEQHRLRIRRKLGLKGKESLTEFLAKL